MSHFFAALNLLFYIYIGINHCKVLIFCGIKNHNWYNPALTDQFQVF
jgi:hypothetical protein